MERTRREASQKVPDYRKYHLSGDLSSTVAGKVARGIQNFDSPSKSSQAPGDPGEPTGLKGSADKADTTHGSQLGASKAFTLTQARQNPEQTTVQSPRTEQLTQTKTFDAGSEQTHVRRRLINTDTHATGGIATPTIARSYTDQGSPRPQADIFNEPRANTTTITHLVPSTGQWRRQGRNQYASATAKQTYK